MLDRIATTLEARSLAHYRGRAQGGRDRPGELVELESGVVRVLRRGNSPRPLVMIPDPPNIIEHQAGLIEELATDHTVYGVEMAGFGRSYLRDGIRYDMDGHCRILGELFDRLDIRGATVCVPCLSGLAVLTFAARNPQAVARLVLLQVPSLSEARRWIRHVDVFGAIRTPVVGQVFTHLLRRRVIGQWYRSALPEPLDEARYEELVSLSRRAFDEGAGFALGSAYQSLAGAAVELPQTTPQLHIWGGSDRTHGRSTTDPKSLLAGMQRAEYLSFPECGHFPDLEDPRRYCAAVRDFEARTESS